MLRARRHGIFRREYELLTDDQPLTTLSGRRAEGAEFSLAGKGYRVERVDRRHFRLSGPEGQVATAERQTGREWTVHARTSDLTLVKPSMWRSRWEVRQHGAPRGEIRHDGAFKSSYSAEVPPDVPVPVAVFAFYVVLVNIERANAAAASAGA
jgi:hypothetical protein